MTIPVAVHVTADVPPEDADQLLHDVRALGLEPTFKAVPVRRGVSDLLWLVLLYLPVKPFLEHLAQEFADDAYAQLKALVGKALHGRRELPDSRRVLELRDETEGLRVELESDLPLEAYRQLFGLDLSSTRGRLRYNRSKKEWRTEPDE
ncbi:MAG: hypothetical protein ACRDRG_00120 [Pseudonocardiaceae bacterium]